MKTNYLFTGILAVAAITVTSCSTPRMAQQSVDTDDVYNSNAQARVYKPAPVVAQQQPASQTQYEEDDYYGTSDPYYDMDYTSRINRFSYGSAWRSYYDPFFFNDWYSPFYGGGFGWGGLHSPFMGGGWGLGLGFNNWGWGFNNWGFNNWGWGFNNFYGGGLWGGGFLGGGFLGNGYYTGRTTNVPNYSARPYLGRENGIGANRALAPIRSTTRRTDLDGNVVRERSRSERYVPADRNLPSRSDRSTAPPAQQSRPARTQQAAPQQPSRPSFTPPPSRSEGSRGSGSSGSSGARPTRSGRG